MRPNIRPNRLRWVALIGLWLVEVAAIAGCSSSSSSSSNPIGVPLAVPAVGTPAAAKTTYQGKLVHARPGGGPTVGWRLQNYNAVGSVPVDITKVAADAKKLSGQMVLMKAHSAQEPGGRMVLVADTLSAYQP